MLDTQAPILQGIVEMDETYIGRKPRYRGQSKRGRGTNKLPTIGAVERNGKAYAVPLANCYRMTAVELQKFAINHLRASNTDLMSDDYRGYSKMGQIFRSHNTVNHSAGQYVNDNNHTNTTEGFWAQVKRVHCGQHHHYSCKHTNLYIAEACFKYNHRQDINRSSGKQVFAGLLGGLCTSL